MKDKPIYMSKTMWGFGLATLIAVAQLFGISASESMIAQLVQALSGLFGVYGLRDAMY